jgi:hypothetical protein
MKILVIEVTPAIAKEWLKVNIGNRPVKPKIVYQYAKDMENGLWQLTHQGIAFSKNNVLIDGQHRLMAIIASNKTVTMTVTFDADENSFAVLDAGVKRSLSDAEKISPKLASFIQQAHAFCYPSEYRPNSSQCNQLRVIFEQTAKELFDCNGGTISFFSTTSVRIAVVFLCLKHPLLKPQILEQYKYVMSGKIANLNPILQTTVGFLLRNRGTIERKEAFARAMKIFNPKNANLKKVVVSPSDIENFIAEFREFVKSEFLKA